MDVTKIKSFLELPDSDQPYVLDWFGGISPNLVENDNPLIECFFTPITKISGDNGNTFFRRSPQDQITAHLAVGYLPTLYLGQVFQNQQCRKESEWPQTEILTIEVDTTTLISEGTLSNIYLEQPLVSKRNSSSANKTQITYGLARQLETTSGPTSWKKSSSLSIAIPDMEIIRYYLTNSSHSCKQIFTGAFQPSQLRKRVTNENREKTFFDEQTRRGRFIYRGEYSKDDALSLARILFEPNEYALRAARSVFHSMLVKRVNFVSLTAYPNSFFPFRQTIRLKVSGRRLLQQEKAKGANNYVFLIHQILACSSVFPFSEISYYSDTAPGIGSAPDDAEIAFESRKFNDTGPAHANPTGGYSLSQERPSRDSAPIIAILGARVFEDLANVKEKWETEHPSTYRSQSRISRRIEALQNASTGQGTGGSSSSARQTLKDNNLSSFKLPKDLETFLDVIEAVQRMKENWKLTTKSTDEKIKTNDGTPKYSMFPAVACEKRTSMTRQFSFMDKAQQRQRALLCIEVVVDNLHLYLFEAQRRPRDSSDDGDKEELPILLLRKHDYREIDGKDFLDLLIKTVELKTWPSSKWLTSFHRDITVHGRGAVAIEDLAKRIIDLIERNFDKDICADRLVAIRTS